MNFSTETYLIIGPKGSGKTTLQCSLNLDSNFCREIRSTYNISPNKIKYYNTIFLMPHNYSTLELCRLASNSPYIFSQIRNRDPRQIQVIWRTSKTERMNVATFTEWQNRGNTPTNVDIFVLVDF